jgi:2-dehydro-3-deoxy-D-arabinonate dehydratase
MRLLQFTNGTGLEVGVLPPDENSTANILSSNGVGVADLIRQARLSSRSLGDVVKEYLDSSVTSVEVDLTNNVVESEDGSAALGLPVSAPEVWAAGLTYKRSREAREEETDPANTTVYSRAYSALRPEMFIKDAGCRRTVASGGMVGVRGDSKWTVPEPEIALILNAHGEICAFTVGNDVTARDIEAVNPLYLPQAKIFGAACSIGPVALVADGEVPAFDIRMRIIARDGKTVFEGQTSVNEMKRPFEELVSCICQYNLIEDGTVLLTGTGIVPPDDFALGEGHQIEIEVPEIGILRNTVAAL